MQQKDTSKTPYRIYNRYKVVQTAVSGLMSGAAQNPDGSVQAVNSAPPGTVSAVNNVLASSAVSSTSHSVCSSSILSADSTTNANSPPQQQHCNSAAAAVTTPNAEALQQVRPMES